VALTTIGLSVRVKQADQLSVVTSDLIRPCSVGQSKGTVGIHALNQKNLSNKEEHRCTQLLRGDLEPFGLLSKRLCIVPGNR
jgi:hypothetical protein